MKGVQHLIDSFRRVLFDGYAGAESTAIRRRIENDRRDVALRRAFIHRSQNLAHHRDIENVERRPREGNSRDTIFYGEVDTLELSCSDHVSDVREDLV